MRSIRQSIKHVKNKTLNPGDGVFYLFENDSNFLFGEEDFDAYLLGTVILIGFELRTILNEKGA